MNYFQPISYKQLFLNIKFWLFLFFLIRLFHITDPPLEVSHNWRQTTVTMAARNFYESGPAVLYPRIDIAGDKTGITGMEFPILNYLIYLVSLVFGYDHWYGRLINLLVSTIGIWFFYKLIKKYFDRDTAFLSAIVLLFSIWFHFSRKIMPDTFSFSLMIASVYYGTAYFEEKRPRYLMLYGSLLLIAVLSKLPSGYALVIFALFFFNPDYDRKTKLYFFAVTLIALLPVCAWYFYWVPHLNKVFGFSHFYMGSSLQNGFIELKDHLFATCSKFFDNALKYVGFLFFITGIFYAIKNKHTTMLYVSGITTLSFLVLMLKAGFAFHHHNYYIIPFVPVMALLCGYGLLQLKKPGLRYLVLGIICLEGFLNNQDDFFIKPDMAQILHLEKDLDSCSSRNDLILINSGNVPTPMYFAHRKGWVSFNDSIADKPYLDKMKKRGLKYIVILKKAFGEELKLDYPYSVNNADYTIYHF